MKITGVRTKLYEHDMLRPLGDANSPTGRKKTAGLAVFFASDEGLTGAAMGAPEGGRAL